MTEKRFTNIEHDYENAWIKCNDDGDFMIYAIYKELDESLPSLEDLLNGLHEENQELKRLVKATVEDYTDLKQSFDLIDKENEQLKKQIGNLEHTKDFCAEVCADCERLEKENEQLKSEINGLEELLKSYRKTIKHDAELLADASKKGYLPPLRNWKEL